MNSLPIQALTREAFAPFGEVIMLEGAKHYPINAGTTERFHELAHVDAAEKGGVPVTQSADDEYLVVVAPEGEFDASQMKAFLATGFQGMSYARGVWQHPLIALHRVSDFLIVDRVGEGNNCDEIELDGQLVLITEACALAC